MCIGKVLYFHRKRQRYNQIYFCAAAQKAAALFVSTYFYLFSPQSSNCSIWRAPIAKQVRAFFLSADHTSLPAACVTEGCPGCRSPPSDFDFAYPLKQIEIGGNTGGIKAKITTMFPERMASGTVQRCCGCWRTNGISAPM